MATCYICGCQNATWRRNVTTGGSYRTTTSSRGTSWNSSSVRYGKRSVCGDCAFQIDYNSKLSGGIFSSILLGGGALCAGIIFGYLLKYFSSTTSAFLSFIGVLILFLGIFATYSSANKWRQENEYKYRENVSFSSSSTPNQLNDYGKASDIYKTLASAQDNFDKFFIDGNTKFGELIKSSEKKDAIYEEILTEILKLRNEYLDKEEEYIALANKSLQELSSISESDMTRNNHIIIENSKKDNSLKIEKALDIFLSGIKAIINLYGDDSVSTIKLIAENFNKEHELVPNDTIEQCDEIIKDLNDFKNNIENENQVVANKISSLINIFNEIDKNEIFVREITDNINLNLSKISNITSQLLLQIKDYENTFFQRKIELLENK